MVTVKRLKAVVKPATETPTKPPGFTPGNLEKLAKLVFRGSPRGLSIEGRVINQWLTLQLMMSLPPNPHPVEVFRGTLRDLSIGGRLNNQRLTLQLMMSLPPNPHPVEVFRGTLRGLSIGRRGLTINGLRYS